MPQTLTINIDTPITSVNMVDDTVAPAPEPDQGQTTPDTPKVETESLDRISRAFENAVAEFKKIQQEKFSEHREQIARLSVEIAKKILQKEIEAGKYEIEKIIQDALKIAPSQQDVLVHLNPIDLENYQRIAKDKGADMLAGIKLLAQPNIGPAECIVETDKGTIEYLIEEHLKQISEALKNTE